MKTILSICFLILNISLKAQNFDCDFSEDFESPVPKCFIFSRDTFEVEYTLFPNPTDGEIQVDSEKPVHIQVLNLNGQILKNTISKRVDLSELPQGVYFIIINRQRNKIVKM